MALRVSNIPNSSVVVIRRAEPTELELATLLTFQVLFETGRSKYYAWNSVVQGVRRVFRSQPGGGYYFAIAHDQYVGQLKLAYAYSDLLDQEIATIEHVYVRPEYRGDSVFDRLYTHAVEVCRARSISLLQLHVVTENQRAMRAYTKRGLQQTGFWMTHRI